MSDPCETCAQAMPIPACATSIHIGDVADDVTGLVVRFTNRATGRVTINDIDPGMLPSVVVLPPLDFAPDISMVAEVVRTIDGVPVGPVEFFPHLWINGASEPSPYAVTCVVFTPVKSFDANGEPYPPGPRFLILE